MNTGGHMYTDSSFFLLFLYYPSMIPIPHRQYDDSYIIYWSYILYIITRTSSMTSKLLNLF